MIQHGVGPASDGATTGLTTFGAAGVMKVPHATGMAPLDVGVVTAVPYLLGVGLPGVAFVVALLALRKPLPGPLNQRASQQELQHRHDQQDADAAQRDD
jgi:hypothetical protein